MDAPRLVLRPGVEESIRVHAGDAYPHECCGALIGRDTVVHAAFALPNTTDEGPRRRFLVRPEDYRAAERHSQERGLDLLGFYHSHPDHPARPSRYDLDHAWPFFSYLIVSVTARGTGSLASWRLRDDRGAFDEEPIDRSTDEATRTDDRAAGVTGDR